MTLWVFGDSYSIPIEGIPRSVVSMMNIDTNIYNTNWIKEVGKLLPTSKANVCAEFGISNEWIFKNVMEQSSNFELNDHVIIQLTNSNRHWFFPDIPAESNIIQMISHPEWSKGKQNAVEGYIKHLQNDQLDNIIYSAIIHSFMYLKLVLPNIKILFLPGWGSAPDTIGNLSANICDYEFDCANTQGIFYSKTGYDPRLNHMSIDNHHVLANKIANYFNNQIPVDLTTGFKSNIYTKDTVANISGPDLY
jgi:hypothetical protein